MANGLHLLLIRLLIVIQLLMNILKALPRIHLIQRTRCILRMMFTIRLKLRSCYRILNSRLLESVRIAVCGRLVEQILLFLRIIRRLRLTLLIKM
nr:MAG TPA: hypothetical protein [Bacteriophage sp.]